MPEPGDNPLKPTTGDLVHTAAKVVVSAVPYVGGSAAELLAVLIRPPATKRLEAWCDGVNRRLAGLRERQEGLDPASLASNDEFVSAVQHAMQIAVRTHQAEKLEALRNAVLNVAAGTAPGDDLQLMFLTFVDTFAPLHLRMLKLFQRPTSYVEESLRSKWNEPEPIRVIRECLPVAGVPDGFYEQVFTDLIRRALLDMSYSTREPADWLHERHSFDGIVAKRTTPLGDLFLAFIDNPTPAAE